MKMNTLNGSLVTEVLKSMQYYFSLALSFVPNVGVESLAEIIFFIFKTYGLSSTVCNYFQFFLIFFISTSIRYIFFKIY